MPFKSSASSAPLRLKKTLLLFTIYSAMDKELFEKALMMPPNERLTFAELILASLDHEEDEIRQTWIKEVHDRMKAVNAGQAQLLDFENLCNVGLSSRDSIKQ